MSYNRHISYRINERDEIVFVNDQWSNFSAANGAPELASDKIIKRSLWSFISGNTIQELYRQILQKARAGQAMRFNLRCDSADVRRFLELSVSLKKNGEVQFNSRTLRAEARPSQMIYDTNALRSDEILIVCSWCKKINTGAEIWEEVENAIVSLGLFDLKALPQLSHGMCNDCYRQVTQESQARFDESKLKRLTGVYAKA
jgi:hypothetical protein